MRASFTLACSACCAMSGAAIRKSKIAAARMEKKFLVSFIFNFLQKRKRACTVTRRIPPVPVTSPKVKEFTTVLMEVKRTVLNTLLAVIRRSSALDSLIVIVLLSDMFIETWPGPSMIFLPASPKLEPPGFVHVALGAQNAAVLNHLSVVGSLIDIDCPATLFARRDPLTPRLMSRPPPRTRGVKYNPDPISREFVTLVETGKSAVGGNIKGVLRHDASAAPDR